MVLKTFKLSDKEHDRIKKWAKEVGGDFNWNTKTWEVECTEDNYLDLRDMNFEIPSELFMKMDNLEVDESWRDIEVPNKYSYLYPDQQEVFRFVLGNNKKVLIASDMGSGKTNTSLSLLDHIEDFPCLIVCPTIVKGGWVEEHKQWLSHSNDKIKMIDKASDMKFYDDAYDIYIMNFQLLALAMKKVPVKGKSPIFMPLERLIEFRRNLFETLLIDEAHYCKGEESQTSQAVRYMSKEVPTILELTGTPFLNSSKELYPLLNILDPERFNNYYAFCKRYCQEKVTWQGRIRRVSYYGNRNQAELHAIMSNGLMIRQTQKYIKECRGEEYMIPNISVLPIKPVKTSKYKEAERDFGAGLNSGDDKKKALGKLSKMRTEAWELKKKASFEFIDSVLEQIEDKVVIFVHNKVLIKDLLAKYKDTMVYIDGTVKTDSTTRNGIRDEFVNDPKVRIFVGSISAVAEGLNGLQRVSHTMIFLQEAWNAGKRDQCYGRVSNRTGQTLKSNIYHLICEGTVEEMFLHLQDKKATAFASIVDGEEIEEDVLLNNIFNVYKEKYKEK